MPGQKHNGIYDDKKDRYADKKAAAVLFEKDKGRSGLRRMEKHEISAVKVVDDDRGDRKKSEGRRYTRYPLRVGAYISAAGQHDGIGGKQYMYGEAVDEHAGRRGQRCPCAEYQGGQSPGDAEGI